MLVSFYFLNYQRQIRHCKKKANQAKFNLRVMPSTTSLYIILFQKKTFLAYLLAKSFKIFSKSESLVMANGSSLL